MPYTDEYDELVNELFGEFGEGSRIAAPTSVVRGKNVKIGKNVVVQTNSLFMSAGGIPAKLIKRLWIADNADYATNMTPWQNL